MWDELKASIQEVIKQNGNNEITGSILQNILLSMVNSLGQYGQYVGEAHPSTNPGSPDGAVFYFAKDVGTYSNFGGYVLASGNIAVLQWNGTQWLTTTINIGEDNAIITIKDYNGNALTITNKAVTLPKPLFSDVMSADSGGETLTAALAKKADLNSPALTGSPTAPTPALNAAGTRVATVAFVRNYIEGGGGIPGEPNVIEVIYAYDGQPLPVVNKAVTLPNVPGDNVVIGGTDTLTNVLLDLGSIITRKANASDVYTKTQADAKFFTQDDATYFLALKADLHSPALSGTPTTTTPANDNVRTQIANVQYVLDKINAISPGGGDVNVIEKIYGYDGQALVVTNKAVTLPTVPSDNVNVVGYPGVNTDLTNVLIDFISQINAKAPKNNPALTGTPTAPQLTTSSPDNQIATKKYVDDHAGGGGGSNVQSDWQQNNPASDSYVKNRTHYKAGYQSVLSAAPVALTPATGYGAGTIRGSLSLDATKKYQVTITDINDSVIAFAENMTPKKDSNNHWYLSKDWAVTTTPGTPQSADAFLLWDNGTNIIIYVVAQQTGDIGVNMGEVSYVKLIDAYIPDTIATVAYVDGIVGNIETILATI